MEDWIMKILKTLVFAGVAALALAAATPKAHAIDVGVNAGVYIPAGDAKDDYKLGYGIKGHVGFDIFPMFDARVFAGYYQADGDGNNFELSSTNGGVMLVFSPPIPVVKPYVGLGYAVHRTKYGPNGSQDDYGHGVVAEAGVNMSILIAELGLYANYMQNEVGDLDLGGWTAGLNASIGF